MVERWMRPRHPLRFLKTDLFEEAFGSDSILFDVPLGDGCAVGMDLAEATAAAARSNGSPARFSFLVTDVRALGLRDDSFEVVLSNSTLDHFGTKAELLAALGELVRVVKPSGQLIVTLDNPWNPFYHVLRWATRLKGGPYFLGYTASRPQLSAWLEDLGMEIVDDAWLIHNPRLVSTLLFLGLRKVLGEAADAPIRALLRLFALFGHLPTAPLTACFSAVCARKPADAASGLAQAG